jgi:hypothetical protein
MLFPFNSMAEVESFTAQWNAALADECAHGFGDAEDAVVRISSPDFTLRVAWDGKHLRVDAAVGKPDMELSAEQLHKALTGTVNLMITLNRRKLRGRPEAVAFLLRAEPVLASAYRTALDTSR